MIRLKNDATTNAPRQAVSIDNRRHGESPNKSRGNKKGGLALASPVGEIR